MNDSPGARMPQPGSARGVERAELDRIIDEYAREAERALGISSQFTETDRGWMRTRAPQSSSA
jgi:hypothetical protein